MDRFLLLLLLLAAAAAGVTIWYVANPPYPIWLAVVSFAIGGLFLIRLTELGLKRAHKAITDPALNAKVRKAAEQAATQASEASEELLRTGKHSATELNIAAAPLLAYLFGFSGRVSRLEYLIVQVVTGLLTLVFFALFLVEPDSWLGILSLLAIGAITAILLAFGVRRTRDIGVNQWWFLLVLVPPANLAMFVALLLVPTDEFKGKGL
ncbi:DUF805 domain-containing protein [Pseudophaeobacter sp. C1-32P7]|uniref:DUF805 domain-containing protein n=1 Tax=Pseudophaeobacter sp. C1-32P7 TaxID=3098142 RepID=UPI0034D79F40